MIKKLKLKFTLLATVYLFILMALLVTGMNFLNYSSTVSDADKILKMLSEMPAHSASGSNARQRRELPPGMSPEVPYESRYFSVTVTENDNMIIDTSKIVSVNLEQAESLADKVLSGNKAKGSIGNFRYLKIKDKNRTILFFLDWGRRLDSFRRFLQISIAIAFSGCVIAFLIFLHSSERIIKPLAEAYEKQKRFITDAGHEIKTPLTIIRANVDLLSSEIPYNESLADIKQQTSRLSELTGNLVYLSKMEEQEAFQDTVDFPVSDIISEEAAAFKSLALSGHKSFSQNITEGLSMNGNIDKIRRLVSVLLENALKYSPENGSVSIELYKKKKSLILTVRNTVTDDIPKEQLSKLFDRFYRTDLSRNSGTGGNGIGLSVAKAIVTSHNGKITAECCDNIFSIKAVF